MSNMRQFDWVPEEELNKKSSENEERKKSTNEERKKPTNEERKKPTKAYFAKGEASFCIENVEDGFTALGKPKTMFKLSIVDKEGKTGTYTVHAVKSAAWQFMNIFNAIGTGIYRQGGYCDDDVLNKNGKLEFGIDESEQYGVQNKVTKWIPYEGKAEPNKLLSGGLPKSEPDNFDDDIPF